MNPTALLLQGFNSRRRLVDEEQRPAFMPDCHAVEYDRVPGAGRGMGKDAGAGRGMHPVPTFRDGCRYCQRVGHEKCCGLDEYLVRPVGLCFQESELEAGERV